jgi:hypothetical protein
MSEVEGGVTHPARHMVAEVALEGAVQLGHRHVAAQVEFESRSWMQYITI